MMIDRKGIEAAPSALRLDLEEGRAEHMGDGMFVVFQSVDGQVQSVTLSATDLLTMLAAT